MNTIRIISNSVYNAMERKYDDLDFLSVYNDPSKWCEIEAENILPALKWFFGEVFPKTARIYFEHVSQSHDVTPFDEQSLERLGRLQGTFYVIVFPGGSVVAAVIVAIVIAVVAVAAAFLFKPAIPSAASRLRNSQSSSPNNDLSSRTNEARPNGRIPDIYGEVWASPDLVTVPFSIYINHQEVEDFVLCLGRGSYSIYEVRDGETSLYEVTGSSLEVFRPNSKINSATPYFTIGADIIDAAVMVVKSNSVNGQELRAPNNKTYQGGSKFAYPNIINSNDNLDGTFSPGDNVNVSNSEVYETNEVNRLMYPWNTTTFLVPYESDAQVADYANSTAVIMPQAFFQGSGGRDPETGESTTITYNLSGTYTVAGASKVDITTNEGFPPQPVTRSYCQVVLNNPSAVNSGWRNINTSRRPNPSYIAHTVRGRVIYHLNGTYTVVGVNGTQITLSSPADVNPIWNDLQSFPGQTTPTIPARLTATGENWVGPFTLEISSRREIISNYVAMNGMYMDDGRNQRATNVTVQMRVQQVDANDNPVGNPAYYETTIYGSAVTKDTRAITLRITTSFTGRCKVSSRRLTNKNTSFEGTVVDEVKWRDLYAVSPLHQDNFGDVTICRLRQVATTGALSLKERKLNMRVCREIPLRTSGSNFTTDLHPTRRADHIFSAISLDPYIGARAKAEMDFDNIYNTIQGVVSYFGTELCAQFCYTIDSDNLTYEETASMVASAVFCNAYRRGNIVRLFFEKKTDQTTILFNHRNKIPDEETRTITMGTESDYDGIEYEYVSPVDDAVITKYVPDRDTGTAKKYQKHESVGVRNTVQAHMQAYRLYNRLIYQHVSAEFDATQEATLLLPGYRILNADNTRTVTQDGEILSQDGLILHTSQKMNLDTTKRNFAFLQLRDASVQSIQVLPGPVEKSMLLTQAPRLPLVLEDDAFARTTYTVAADTEVDADLFLVTELDTNDNFIVTVMCVNYDDRYYQNDTDYKNGIVS